MQKSLLERFRKKIARKVEMNLATNASLNTKINEVKGKIPNITNLATASSLTAVENKIPNVPNLVKENDYSTKINKIEKKITDQNHDKFIITKIFNKLTADNFTARLKQAHLASKNDFANFVKNTEFHNKLKDVMSSKKELNELSKKVKAILTKGLAKDLINEFSFLNGAKYFSLGMFQAYLVFIPDI